MVKAWIGEYGKVQENIIADSGADITLVSQEVLKKMKDPPRIKTGQPLNLVQVTGNAELKGFVTFPIFIDTDQGPVELSLDAYVVKGMTAPLLLGNDFADQYCISIIREEGSTHLYLENRADALQFQIASAHISRLKTVTVFQSPGRMILN